MVPAKACVWREPEVNIVHPPDPTPADGEELVDLLGGHATRGVFRQHREDLVVGVARSGVPEQVSLQPQGEPVGRVR